MGLGKAKSIMRTFPIVNEQKVVFAFEIENVYIGSRTIARLVRSVLGVTDVRVRKPFTGSAEVHVEFQYHNQPYVVWEPFGDSSRYWIGPDDPDVSSPSIDAIERVFREYRPGLLRRVFGDVVSLKFITGVSAGRRQQRSAK